MGGLRWCGEGWGKFSFCNPQKQLYKNLGCYIVTIQLVKHYVIDSTMTIAEDLVRSPLKSQKP